jgi:hypothetical protein
MVHFLYLNCIGFVYIYVFDVHATNNYGICRMIEFINTSVTHALLITINYKQYSAIVVDLHYYNSPLLTH